MAQQKKTESIDPQDLPELTPKQQHFVRCILEGMTASDAYRTAYDCQNMLDSTIWREASVVKNNPDVTTWIQQATINGMALASRTKEQHINRLQELSIKAELAGNYGASVQAEQLAGKCEGLYTEQIEIKDKSTGNEALYSEISNALGTDSKQIAQDFKQSQEMPSKSKH